MPWPTRRQLRLIRSRPRASRLMHTWLSTQDEGWWRVGLDQLQVPFSYISTQDVAKDPDLKSKYDVIIFAPVGRDPRAFVTGMPMFGNPLPWKTTHANAKPRQDRFD